MKIASAVFDYEQLAEWWIASKRVALFLEIREGCQFRIARTQSWFGVFMNGVEYDGCKLHTPCGCSVYCKRVVVTKADWDKARKEVRKNPERWL